MAQRARDLSVGEQVLERLRSSETGGTHAIPVAPGADGELGCEVAHGHVAQAAKARLDLPVAEARPSGHRERHRVGRGRIGATGEAERAVFGYRAQATAEVERLRAALAESEDLLDFEARKGPAGDLPKHEAAHGRRILEQRGEQHRPARPRAPSRPRSTTPSSTSASSRSCLAVSAIVRSAPGDSSRSASITSWRTRARAKRRSAFEGSSRHSSPRARRYSRTSSRVTPSSGRTSRPRRGDIPCSARDPGETARR